MNFTPSVKSGHTDSERIFWLMFGLIVLSWISIGMVLPALPGLSDALQTSSSGVKLSVSIYLIFFAFSQLVWSAIIQKIGARKTIYSSFVLALIGTFIAMLAFNLPLYIIYLLEKVS